MARSAKKAPAAPTLQATSGEDYVAPPLVDVQSMIADPRRSLPQKPDAAQVEASHQASVESVRDEMGRQITRHEDVDSGLIERSRATSLDEVREQMPLVADRLEVIKREGASHEESLDLIRREMQSATVTIVSSR